MGVKAEEILLELAETDWQRVAFASAALYGFISVVAMLLSSALGRAGGARPPQVARRSDDFDSLVSDNLEQIVEMSYWFVKFVSDFENNLGVEVDEDAKIFAANSASVVKYARYMTKFIKSFEKLYDK